jgi:hypothetical protein
MTTKKPKRTAKKFLRIPKKVAIKMKKRSSTLRLMMSKNQKNSMTCGPNSKNGKMSHINQVLRKIWKQSTN